MSRLHSRHRRAELEREHAAIVAKALDCAEHREHAKLLGWI